MTGEKTCQTKFSCYNFVTQANQNEQENGCIPEEAMQQLLCHPRTRAVSGLNVKCCDENLCNQNITLTLPPPIETKSKPDVKQTTLQSTGYGRTVIIAICISAPVCLITLAIMLFIYLRDRRLSMRHKNLVESDAEFAIGKVQETIQDILAADGTYSGSGSGLPLLIQRTIARQIVLHECIGKGRYGEVYRGQWRGENVAVKIFSTRDECSWHRETEMYQTVMLRHENILGFIAADNKDNGTWTQLWLVTDYHKNGSLCDYLKNVNEVNMESMLRMAYTIAAGLAHLHMEVHGTRGKPAIAHRDLKSQNILVKRDGSCCIADLGLAVYYQASDDTFDLPDGSRVGTKRYMAPEVLESSEPKSFHAFKKIDVYAMGLVLWEIARRCSFSGLPGEEYQLPYYEKVQSDPSIEEMKETVCIEKFRPSIPNKWSQNPTMNTMSKIMKECWYENSAARLPALRVKKTLAVLGNGNDPVKV